MPQENETALLFKLLLPPQLIASGAILNEQETETYIKTIMRWLIRPSSEGNRELERQNLSDLGLRRLDGSLDRDRALTVNALIWRDVAGEPSFDKLHGWLVKYDQQAQMRIRKEMDSVKSKKKAQRKQRKISRRRNR